MVLDVFRRLHDAGATVAVGTDAGLGPATPHDVLPYGMATLAKTGMTNAEVLHANTCVAARAIGLGTVKGRIGVGFDADLLTACQSTESAEPSGVAGGPSVPAATTTTAAEASVDPAKAAAVTDIVRKAMAQYKLEAAIYRVTIDGKNVVTAALGESMTGVPANTDMHFRNGSVAESSIANLLLQLQEENKISLDDKLSKGCPSCPTPTRSRFAT
jgi:hypothetical protein